MWDDLASRRHRWLVGPPAAVLADAREARRPHQPLERPVLHTVTCGLAPVRQAAASRQLLGQLAGTLYSTRAWDRHRAMISALAPEVMQRVDDRIGDDLIAEVIDSLITQPRESAYSEVEVEAWSRELADVLVHLAADNGEFSVLVQEAELADPCDEAIIVTLLRDLPPELVQVVVGSRTERLPSRLSRSLYECGVRAELAAGSNPPDRPDDPGGTCGCGGFGAPAGTAEPPRRTP